MDFLSAIPDIDDLCTRLPCSCGTFISVGEISSSRGIEMERVVIAMVETKAGAVGTDRAGVCYSPISDGLRGMSNPSRGTSGRRATPLLSANEFQMDHRELEAESWGTTLKAVFREGLLKAKIGRVF